MLIRFGACEFDIRRDEFTNKGQVVVLRPLVRRLLVYLALNHGRVVPIDELHREVWGARHVSESTVHQAIRACRRAVGDDGRTQQVIETAARSGYQFVREVRFLSSAPVRAKEPVVGRESTLADLEAAVGAAMDGRGRITLISGEPGIGKTHTLEQVEQIACESGALVVRGTGNAQAGAPLFWPWVQVFRALAAGRPVGSFRREVAAIVPGLLDAEIDNGPLGIEPDANSRFRVYDAAVRCLIDASQLSPLVVLLDDFHEAGSAAFDLVHLLSQSIRTVPLLVCVAYRPAEATLAQRRTESLGRLRSEPSVHRVDLGALNDEEARRLIRLAQSRELDDSLVGTMTSRARGNPFYLRELTHSVSEPNEEYPVAAAAVAAGVQSLIEARVSAMSPAAMGMMKVASAFGSIIERAMLTRVLEESSIDGPLAEASHSGILFSAVSDPGSLTFSHDLLREAIYDSISIEERRSIHLRIGQALDGRRPAERAHHLAEAVPAGDLEKALSAQICAAEYAERQFDYETAARAYRRAIGIHHQWSRSEGENVERQCTLLLASAAMDIRSDNGALAREALVEVMDIARVASLPKSFANAALAHAYSVDYRWSADMRVIAQLEEALAGLPVGNEALDARLMARLAVELRYVPRQIDRASALLDAAATKALRDPAALARVLEDTSMVQWSVSDPHGWIELNQRIVRAARQAGDEDLLFRGVKGLATGAMEVGDRIAMEREIERCAALASACPAPYQCAVTALHESSLRLLDGDFAEAEAGSLAVIATDIPDVVGVGMLQLFYQRLEVGRIEELEPEIRKVAHEFPIWQMLIARMLVELERQSEARSVLQSLPDPSNLFRHRLWLPSLAGLAEAAAELRDQSLCATLYRALEPYAGTNVVYSHGAIFYGNTSHFLAMLARTQGEHQDAREHLAIATQAHRNMSARAWTLRTRVESARLDLAVGDPEQAAADLAPARAEASSLGMRALVREIDRALDT